MKVTSFNELDLNRQQELFDFVVTVRGDTNLQFDDMVQKYTSAMYNNGDTLFVVCDGEQIYGTLGVIDREALIRKEVFLSDFNLCSDQEQIFSLLLKEVQRNTAAYSEISIKMGIPVGQINQVIPVAQANGFQPVYRFNIYKLADSTPLQQIRIPGEVTFQNLDSSNKLLFVSIHNAGFMQAPNGSTLTSGEVDELVQETEDFLKKQAEKKTNGPSLHQIGFFENKPAIMISLELNGEEGWLELAVHPDFHGQGLGKVALKQACESLYQLGCTQIYLSVVDSNTPALQMYQKYGFVEERELSQWFEWVK